MQKLHIKAFSGKLFRSDEAQGLAEYAAMLGLLLGLLVVAKMVGYHASQLLRWVAANMQ